MPNIPQCLPCAITPRSLSTERETKKKKSKKSDRPHRELQLVPEEPKPEGMLVLGIDPSPVPIVHPLNQSSPVHIYRSIFIIIGKRAGFRDPHRPKPA